MMTPIEESERNLPRRVRPFGVKRMVRRYAHLAADPLAVHAGNVGIHGTNTAQSGEYPRVASGCEDCQPIADVAQSGEYPRVASGEHS